MRSGLPTATALLEQKQTGEDLWERSTYHPRSRQCFALGGRLIVTSSIAFPVKAYNARRHPQVAVFFSDPTGAPLTEPPAVLVQGDAIVTELVDDPPWSYAMFKESILRQPRTRSFVSNPLARRLFTFQFQRLAIFVQPRRILVWPWGDMGRTPTELEVRYVE